MCSGLDAISGARFIALSVSHGSLFMNVDQCSVGVNRDALCVIMYSETRRRNFLQRRDHNALRFGGVGTFRHCYTFVGSRVDGRFGTWISFYVLDAEARLSQCRQYKGADTDREKRKASAVRVAQ